MFHIPMSIIVIVTRPYLNSLKQNDIVYENVDLYNFLETTMWYINTVYPSSGVGLDFSPKYQKCYFSGFTLLKKYFEILSF